MATLGSQSIASSYEQLLHVDRDGGGNGTTLVSVKDGDNGTTFDIQLSSNSTNFQTDFQIGGTAVSSTAAELNLLDGSSDANSTVSKAVILDSSGNIALPDGKGIDFSAASGSAAGSDNALLDDYEEGTWTPVLGGSGGTSGQTYATRAAKYVKVGGICHCYGYLQLSNKGTITDSLQIQDFPFSNIGNWVAVSFGRQQRWSLTADHILTGALYDTYVTLWETDHNGDDVVALSTSNVENSTRLTFQVTYPVA